MTPNTSHGVETMMTRASDGSLVIAAKHPVGCPTWHWSISLTRKKHVQWGWRLWSRDKIRTHQWHDYYRLPFGRTLIVSHQDYHKKSAA